jgi:hypothetical protein
VFPLVWRRFSPALGETRLSRSGAALVQHMYTEDVRQLLRR